MRVGFAQHDHASLPGTAGNRHAHDIAKSNNRTIVVLHELGPNAQGKRHRSTEGAQGTNKGQDNGEALALVGVRLTAQLG